MTARARLAGGCVLVVLGFLVLIGAVPPDRVACGVLLLGAGALLAFPTS